LREHPHPLHGLQTWVALPRARGNRRRRSSTTRGEHLPQQRRDGAWLRVVAGAAMARNRRCACCRHVYVAIDLDAEPNSHSTTSTRKRALYVLEGDAQLDGVDIPAQHLIVLDPAPAAPARRRR
jgi:redox-sensitive bicupin YhaK (pirin superfamily)